MQRAAETSMMRSHRERGVLGGGPKMKSRIHENTAVKPMPGYNMPFTSIMHSKSIIGNRKQWDK